MKFTCSITVNKSRDEVTRLWQNPDNLKEWQDGFISFTHIEGEAGKNGAKSRMLYMIRGKEMELIETIIDNSLPNRFKGRYDHKHMSNTMENTFTALSENQTRWDAEIEYVLFNGFMIKLMAKLFPSMFKKQTQKWLDQFKVFAEA